MTSKHDLASGDRSRVAKKPPAKPSLGLRERHKLAKLARISDAAILLFGRDGYEGTTLRDIAHEADVALGTLSLYARDKRDLVLMIFNKILPPLIELGNANAATATTIVDRMVAFFSPFYFAYASNPTLYRIVLGQIYNGPDSIHAEANDAIRVGLLDHLTIILERDSQGGGGGVTDPHLQARCFFYLYFADVRTWLFQQQVDPVAGIAALRGLYAVHARGLLTTEQFPAQT